VFVLKVTDHAGNTLYEWQPAPLTHRVIDERVAWLITDILSDNDARIPAFGPYSALNIARPAAAKTGTTTDFRDNWVVGYTPNLVVGVWVGNADNSPMQDVTGVSGAAPIWNAYMRRVLLGQPELIFARPDGLVQQEVCSLSGLLPTPACALRRMEWFIEGTAPSDYDSFYQTFTIDHATGLLADDSTPPERRVDEVFVVLPQEARDWAARNGIRTPPIGAQIVNTDSETGLRLLEPDPHTSFEISPITPAGTQRIRLTVGAPPGTQSVTYIMDGAPLGTVESAPWELWWTLEYGVHELAATARLADGSQITAEIIPFRVTRYAPPGS
jgi:membrane carboxypeptidase/penicillin-binding protein PbpC